MTISDAVPVPLPASRTQVALTAANTAHAVRQEVSHLLQNERAAYAELLSREGVFEGILRDWLVNEVLPSIRKYGGYVVDETFRRTAASIADDNTGLLMLPILADISEEGLTLVDEENARIEHEDMHPPGFSYSDGPALDI